MAVRNLEQQVEYLTKELTKLKQQLGGALPDPIAGPQGDPGPQGDTGPQGPRGPGMFGCTAVLPSPTAYKEGDFYQLFNGNQYKKINGSWVLQTSLRGPQGVVGPAGGTEVIANPVTVATDNLEKLTVDGTTYNTYGGWAAALNNYIYYEDSNGGEITCDLPFNMWNGYVTRNFRIDNDLFVQGFSTFDDSVEFGNKASFKDIDRIVDSDDNPLIICENLNDANGKPRFLMSSGTPLSQTGFTATYCKWSLSGSHLMVVLAGNIANGTNILLNTVLANFELPDFIKSKIIPSMYNLIQYKSIECVSTSYSTNFLNAYFDKVSNGITLYVAEEYTATDDMGFRVQLDLLIDMA